MICPYGRRSSADGLNIREESSEQVWAWYARSAGGRQHMPRAVPAHLKQPTPASGACKISNEWHIFQAFPLWRLKYVDHLATSTVVPQLMPVLLLIHRVLALQILLLDEVNSKWSFAGTQAQTLFSKFNPDVIIITVNLQWAFYISLIPIQHISISVQHPIHFHYKDEHWCFGCWRRRGGDYKTILASGSFALSSCVALRHN